MKGVDGVTIQETGIGLKKETQNAFVSSFFLLFLLQKKFLAESNPINKLNLKSLHMLNFITNFKKKGTGCVSQILQFFK